MEGELDITRAKENHRLMDLRFKHRISRLGSAVAAPITYSDFYLEWIVGSKKLIYLQIIVSGNCEPFRQVMDLTEA
jgi:hypothetical protein